MCYDRAGEAEVAISTLKKYVDEHIGKSEWTDALFYLAQAHQSIGQFEEAIIYYSTVRNRHPNMPAAINSIIPMARCYLSLETPDKEKAEKLLQAVLSDPAMTPRAPKFHEAMIVLGELYYDSERYEEAIPLLSEAIARNLDDQNMGKWLFLVGDSYRKSGLMMDSKLSELAEDKTGSIAYEKLKGFRRENMAMAERYFHQAITFFDNKHKATLSRIEKINLRYSCLYRGDCLYELENYAKAVDVFENTALRYEMTPTALEAFVQIINCNLQLGNENKASSANKRAVYQLSKMSDESLAENVFGRTRQEWQEWFSWTDQAGLWGKDKAGDGIGRPAMANNL